MKELLKRVYWKLPIGGRLKLALSQWRFERMLRKERRYDASGLVSVAEDPSLAQDYMAYVLAQYKTRASEYREYESHEHTDADIVLAAYYLTQFHPNSENDEWWGAGTTEWNNVNQAVPQFVGHYQPRKPGELGYYDLRIKDVMARQVEMARNYGIGAFCFYYYWFDGDRLLEQPIRMFLDSKELDLPFFYCWANENWTRRFSGTSDEVLKRITPTVEAYKSFIDSVVDDFADIRYHKIKGRPVLSVYRPSLIPEPSIVLKHWRDTVRLKTGLALYLIAVQERVTSIDWTLYGFDAETEFQPKQVQHACTEISRSLKPARADFGGQIYDYEDLVKSRRFARSSDEEKKVYPAVMPMWDNTARRNFRGTIFHGSTPALYSEWLSVVLGTVSKRGALDQQLVFINAWNEWGEGAYLEPDDYYGYAYLQATYDALIQAESVS